MRLTIGGAGLLDETHLGLRQLAHPCEERHRLRRLYRCRGREPVPVKQQVRDAEVKPKIAAAHIADYGVFGARKVWLTLNRERPIDAKPPR